LGRCLFQTGRLLRELSRRLHYLWLTAKIWGLRFYRLFVKYPGWTIAAVTGAVGIVLLAIVQIEAFLPQSVSKSESPIEPFIEVTGTESANEKQDSEKSEVLHNDSVNSHPAQIESNAQPDIDIDVVLLLSQDGQKSSEQFLVTSVREQQSLNQTPILPGKSLWNASSLNHDRIAIQPAEFQSPEFGNEPQSGESFVEPLPTTPTENGIQYAASDSLSSASTTTVTTAEITTEQTMIVTSPKLKMIVTIADRTQLGQPERIQFRLVNSGQVSAVNVILGIEIPEEFTYSKGRSLEFQVGTIPPGETRVARLTPRAAKTGIAVFEIELSADAEFSQILKRQVEISLSD
jgi:hypothetical protein